MTEHRIIHEDGGNERHRIRCSCGWLEECYGFDAGAFAHAAWADHLADVGEPEPPEPQIEELADEAYEREGDR